ncbi:hypothetical protein T4B_2310 [Trichinella pseudospiralis]|uniref:Uncharacterized protein n=1 Tax=Trichinella pseudospiralis TaxID=6337 RepID=A0A0V1IA19_TRIPS|nr:hypothetical protein T4B_2310 [Trichinella pseudospiralis]
MPHYLTLYDDDYRSLNPSPTDDFIDATSRDKSYTISSTSRDKNPEVCFSNPIQSDTLSYPDSAQRTNVLGLPRR